MHYVSVKSARVKVLYLLHDLRRLALDPSAAVVFLHVVILVLVPSPAPGVTVLKVGVDVEVVVHAVGFLRLQLLGEVALQLLELLLGEEVGLGEHHLEGASSRGLDVSTDNYNTLYLEKEKTVAAGASCCKADNTFIRHGLTRLMTVGWFLTLMLRSSHISVTFFFD